jgi:hypothetical protein
LGWFLVAVLGMIWLAFLLPHGRFGLSTRSSVEEFGRNMDLLAEANRSVPGRWVIMPRRGARFMDPRDRLRARIRRRRRQVLALLGEVTGLLVIIGLFPPLHAMLYGALILLGLLLVYGATLARVRAAETARARLVAAARSRAVEAPPARRPVAVVAPLASSDWGSSPLAERLDDLVVDDDVHVIVHRSDEVDLEELRSAAAAR